MRRTVFGSGRFLEWFASIGPIERMSHRCVVVVEELLKFFFEVLHGREVSPADHFPHDDTEDRFDLVQPGTVFRQINEANPV